MGRKSFLYDDPRTNQRQDLLSERPTAIVSNEQPAACGGFRAMTKNEDSILCEEDEARVLATVQTRGNDLNCMTKVEAMHLASCASDF
jgi:hypothetical protein